MVDTPATLPHSPGVLAEIASQVLGQAGACSSGISPVAQLSVLKGDGGEDEQRYFEFGRWGVLLPMSDRAALCTVPSKSQVELFSHPGDLRPLGPHLVLTLAFCGNASLAVQRM